MTILLGQSTSLCGVSSRLVRLAAREMYRMRSARLWDLAVVLGAPPADIAPLWEALKKAGCIAEVDGWWRPTDSMHTLANARLGPPLSRASADRLVEQLISRAVEANSLETGPLYYITRVAVFGSYLDEERESLGDLDVAWSLLERPGCYNQILSMFCVNRDATAHMRGLVRPRHQAVRLIDWHELERLQCPYRVMMEFTGPRRIEAESFAQAETERRRSDAAEWGALMEEMMSASIGKIVAQRTGSPNRPKERRSYKA